MRMTPLITTPVGVALGMEKLMFGKIVFLMIIQKQDGYDRRSLGSWVSVIP